MKVWHARAHVPEDLREAAEWLRSGRIVAFPTETVYGLGANACDEAAVTRIFRAKGRPSDNPLIVHIADRTQLASVTPSPHQLPAAVQAAMDAFWPGPLTILLPAHPGLAPSVHPGVATVGVRIPRHPLAQALLQLADCPIAAPSANKSGRPSPTQANHVMADLADDIDGIVDGGACSVGLESTVVSIGADAVVILRPGAVTAEALTTAIGLPVTIAGPNADAGAAIASPGLKYRHYAPDAEVQVWQGHPSAVARQLRAVQAELTARGAVVAVIGPTDSGVVSGPLSWTPQRNESYELALGRELYALLRSFDHAGASHILIHAPSPQGFGLAVLNRLERAAHGRVYAVQGNVD